MIDGPDEVLQRALALLARRGLVACGALPLVVGPWVGLLAFAAKLAEEESAVGAWLLGAGSVVSVVAWGVVVVAIPLAAFASGGDGRDGVLATLLHASRILLRVLLQCYLGAFLQVPVVVCSALLLAAFGSSSPDAIAQGVAVAGLIAFGLASAWVHGSVVLMDGAEIALGRTPAPVGRGEIKALIVGSPPFLALGAFAGGVVLREAGARWSMLPDSWLVVLGGCAVFVAHVVSCALAVASVSRRP